MLCSRMSQYDVVLWTAVCLNQANELWLLHGVEFVIRSWSRALQSSYWVCGTNHRCLAFHHNQRAASPVCRATYRGVTFLPSMPRPRTSPPDNDHAHHITATSSPAGRRSFRPASGLSRSTSGAWCPCSDMAFRGRIRRTLQPRSSMVTPCLRSRYQGTIRVAGCIRQQVDITRLQVPILQSWSCRGLAEWTRQLENKHCPAASTACCHGQCRRSVINLGGPGHLSPSVTPPFFPFLSWTPQEVCQSPRSPAVKHFDAIYTVKQPYVVMVFSVLQKSACKQSSAAVGRTIVWITGHV